MRDKHLFFSPGLCWQSVKAAWLLVLSEELKLELNKYFRCLNIDRATIQSLQLQICVCNFYFLGFIASLGSPLNPELHWMLGYF